METSNRLSVKQRSSQKSGEVSDQTEPATRQQRKHSLALLLSPLPLVTLDSSQVDHQNRTDEHLGDTDLTANRQFPGLASKGMSHATRGALALEYGDVTTAQQKFAAAYAIVQQGNVGIPWRVAFALQAKEDRLRDGIWEFANEKIGLQELPDLLAEEGEA